MQKTKQQITEHLESIGICRGASVTWDGFSDKRYGVVMSLDGVERDGKVEVQAYNGLLRIAAAALKHAPEVSDAWLADYQSIWGKQNG
tara:strand:- start:296 stop:559 length:264 start_codon:yes stop_codon:yes gene_type:complete